MSVVVESSEAGVLTALSSDTHKTIWWECGNSSNGLSRPNTCAHLTAYRKVRVLFYMFSNKAFY